MYQSIGKISNYKRNTCQINVFKKFKLLISASKIIFQYFWNSVLSISPKKRHFEKHITFMNGYDGSLWCYFYSQCEDVCSLDTQL